LGTSEKVEQLPIQGKGKRGTPKLKWRDKFEEDWREKGWRKEEVLDRRVWRGMVKEVNAASLNWEEAK
jgi:hypothetical protein